MNFIGPPKKILFVPASGPKGTGEYIRSLNIAQYIESKHPQIEIHFLLNQLSSASENCPFRYTLLPNTPAYCTREVNAAMDEYEPDLVIFDATGRSAQLKNANRLGARTIFIAQNKTVLSRGLGLNRLTALDELWIAQPASMLRATGINQLKARLSGIDIIPIGPVFPIISEENRAQARRITHGKPFVLVNPGGGGHFYKGEPVAKRFEGFALALKDHTCVLVYGPNYEGDILKEDHVIGISAVNPGVFNALVELAGSFISGGGGALFQAAHFNVPSVALSISPDQDVRIDYLTSEYPFILKAENPEEVIRLFSELPQKTVSGDPGIPEAYRLIEKRLSL